MKPRFFTTLLCALLTYTAFSQNYMSLLDGTELQYCYREFSATYHANFTLSISDTINFPPLGNVKRTYFSPFSPIDSSRYLLENDFGRVWFYDENTFSGPALIYDFSLNEGDIVQVATGDHHFNGGFTSTVIEVVEIDIYVSPSGTSHKRLHIHHINGGVWYPYNTWIEGVGATSGGLLYAFSPSDPDIQLNEARKDSELIYEETQFGCVVAVEPAQQAGILLWHQNNTIHIERPNEQAADFFVYDITGRLLYTQKIGQYTNIDIDLPNGVYVGYFREDSGEQYSGKFLVTD